MTLLTKADWPVGGGEVGEMLRRWTGAETALGPPDGWPPALKTVLQLILTSPTPMTLFWGEHGVMLYNDAYAVIAGAKHPHILGLGFVEAWPEVLDFHREVMAALLVGRPLSYRDLALVLHRNGVAEDVRLNVDYSPIFDEAGAVAGVLAVVFETTAIVRAQEARDAAEAALRRREEELAQVQKIGKVGGLDVDLRQGFRSRRSPEYLLLHGLQPDAVDDGHEDWLARLHPQDRRVAEAEFKEAVAGDARDYHAEYRIVRPSDGATRWIEAVGRIERDDTGAPLRLVGAHLDITARKEAETQQRLLMQELSHRVKNSLAMVQAIASQTMRNAGSLEAARKTFGERLAALSRAHDLLLGGDWAHAALAAIVDSVTGIQGEPARFAIRGPDIVLGPKAALALSLILHELTTNAIKYGALSNATGRVSIIWRIDDIEGERQFRLRWQEQGGPPVATPTRLGFGSRLIERTFPSVSGRAETSYPPAGLVFTLDAPFSALSESDEDEPV